MDPRKLGARCDECPLKGKTVVPPETSKGKTRLILVGEGPGRKEEATGRPFVGVSGALLNEVLQDAGIRRSDCHVTNAALCRGETDAETATASICCAPRLLREVAAINAPLVTLGKEATRSILGVSNIILSRGFVWKARDVSHQAAAARVALRRATAKGVTAASTKAAYKLEILEQRNKLAGRPVFPTVHPAFVLRSEAWRPLLEIDLKRAGKWIRGELSFDALENNIKRVELEDFLQGGRGLWWAGSDPATVSAAISSLGKTVSCDIETTITCSVLTSDIVCVGLSDGANTVVIDPWVPTIHGPLLGALLENRVVVGHNFINFDMLALTRDGVTFSSTPEDTLLAHHAFASHFPQKLDQVVSTFCDSGPWKIVYGRRGAGTADEKGGLPPADMLPEERDLYCAMDCVLTKLAWDRLQTDLEPERSVYEADKKLAMLCQSMQRAGIGVDLPMKDRLSSKLKRRKAALKGRMRTLLRWPVFSPRKPDDVRRALYKRLRAQSTVRTPTGQQSTANEVLESLAMGSGKAAKFAATLSTYRLVEKVGNTFVDPIGGEGKKAIHLSPDERAHFNWKAFGTVSGRMAGRFQSIPRGGPLPEQKVRSLYTAKGNVKYATIVAQIHDAAIFEVGSELVYFDLAQAEARLAAYLSGDEALIQAVETDIHTANAQLLFGGMPAHPDFPSLTTAQRLARASEKSPSGVKWKNVNRSEGGCKEERDVTKNAGFCVWYVGEADTVFQNLQKNGFNVPLRVCQIFYDRCHDKYWQYYKYVNRNLEMVRSQGYIRTAASGRMRRLGYFAPITDVANYPIQAGIADEMNARLVVMAEKASCMTSADDVENLIVETWKVPVVLPKGPIVSEERRFVLPAEVKRGKRWSDL